MDGVVLHDDRFIIGLLIAGVLSAVGLSIRYFVCLARCERRTPWSTLLGFGWLAFLTLVVMFPAGFVRGQPSESDLNEAYINWVLFLSAMSLWCAAFVAFAARETAWRIQRRRQKQMALRPAR